MSYLFFKNPSSGEVHAYDQEDETQLPYIQKAQDENWEDMTGNWPPAPSQDDLLLRVKNEALGLIVVTDYTQLPDVSTRLTDSSREAFVAYREAVREIFINPMLDPVWPTKPSVEWK
jgi:hypothetical protein